MFNRINLTQIENAHNISELYKLVWNVIKDRIDLKTHNERTVEFRKLTQVEPTEANLKACFEKIKHKCYALCENKTYHENTKNYNLTVQRGRPFSDECFFLISALVNYRLANWDQAALCAGKLSDAYKQNRAFHLDSFYTRLSLIAWASYNKQNQKQAEYYLENYKKSLDRVGRIEIKDVEVILAPEDKEKFDSFKIYVAPIPW